MAPVRRCFHPCPVWPRPLLGAFLAGCSLVLLGAALAVAVAASVSPSRGVVHRQGSLEIDIGAAHALLHHPGSASELRHAPDLVPGVRRTKAPASPSQRGGFAPAGSPKLPDDLAEPSTPPSLQIGAWIGHAPQTGDDAMSRDPRRALLGMAAAARAGGAGTTSPTGRADGEPR